MDFEDEHIQTQLMRIREVAGSAAMVSAIMSVIASLIATLSPMIGIRGAAALYARSVHIARDRHPWLPDEGMSALEGSDTLRSILAERSDVETASAAAAILASFNTVLVSLIGQALATRLLSPVFLAASNELSSQQALH